MSDEVLSLPISPILDKNEIEEIVETVNSW
jgi:dTDP-4-amino-4,6-dideoxygalactose transaminase